MFEKVLSTPTAQVGRIGRFAIFQIKLWIHCFRLLKKNRSGQQAAAMSYYTMFGLVPLAVVMLMVFQFLPAYKDAGQKIKDSVYTQLHLSTIEYPDPANSGSTIKLTDNLDAIVAKVFTGFNQGTIAILGAVLIIFAALMMLLTIEGAFDQIWGVGRGRSIVHRIVNYWALLTLGPLLLATAIYVATKYAAISQIQKTVLSHTAPIVVSYLASVAGFFLLYLLLPNTKVKVPAAIWGAVVAAIVWTIAKWVFKLYVVKFIPYNEVYGVLGLIPLGIFWIYLGWFIVLFGLQLTYTTQHLSTLDAAEIAAAQKQEEYFIANDLTIMNMVGEIASAFQAGDGAVEAATISSKLNIPVEFTEKILAHLVARGILARASEPKDGFLPAKAPSAMKLSEIAAAISLAGFGQSADVPAGLQKVAQSQQEMFSQFNVTQLIAGEDGERN
ncbi:MAG: YihY family inner membrane protein [Planctomycetes bacterium]|nr:YihY family inner membrane protein [Planctomycetota bacterium]